MKILLLDESGDHDLINIDLNYPLFVLAGCVIDEAKHNNTLTKQMSDFKKDVFNNVSIILHYVDYTRNKNGFEKMSEKSFRENFYGGLNKIIKDTDFKLIACIVDKVKHKNRYGMLAIDPYILGLEIIIERFVFMLEESGEKGVIIAESRGDQLDNELQLAYLNTKIKGTRYLKPIQINNNIENFMIKKKSENIAGLQLTDSLVTSIGRKYLNKKNYYVNYDVIKSKFRKIICGKYKGYGLVILPSK